MGKNIRSVIVGLGSVWVSSVDEDTVTRLDPSSGAVVGEPITVGDRPKEMAVAGGSIWVVNEGSNSVSRIDPKAGRVVGPPIAVGTRPWESRPEPAPCGSATTRATRSPA